MTELTASELAAHIQSRQISASEATKASLARIEQLDGKLKAFVTVNAEAALAQACQIDSQLARGEAVGPLAGVPIAIKDNICVRGVRTTCSSRILERFVPPYDAHVTELLRKAGAVIVGKTNLDEFAMGSSTENSGFFCTRNPWKSDCTPGGSSGGSAAAVAAGLVSVALGSDTGGSIRQPASFCGITGLKPTYGRVSRYGLVAYGSSLDQIGPLARDVADCALLLQVIAGHDGRDSTSSKEPVPDFAAGLDKSLQGMKIGVPKEYFGEGINQEVEQAVRSAIEALSGLGADIREVSLPHTQYAIAVYYIIATAEASSNLARYDGVHYGYRTGGARNIVELYSNSRRDAFGAEVKRRIMLGTFALSAETYEAYYLKASKVRTLIRRDFDTVFGQVDCLVCPTSPTPPFRIGELVDDPLSMYLADIYTISLNLAGLPGISIPCGFTSDGLPVGFQVFGRAWDEATVLRVAAAYQKSTDHHLKRPAL
jgi:aspartyl-tRNA(Asn)/glutamyl-tRNA(Gln) amidotransferase subunit A